MLNKQLKIQVYIAVVCATAIAVAGRLGMPGQWDNPWLVAGLLLAGGAAGAWPVRIPNVKIQFTVSHPLVLCALGMLGPAPAMAAAMAGVLGATLYNRRKSTWSRLLFNLGSQALTSGLAGWFFILTGGRSGSPLRDLLLPMFVATTVLFVVNTVLVALVVSLDQHTSFLATCRESLLWSAVSYYTGLSFAAAIMLLNDSVGAPGFVLGIAPVWMLVSFNRTQKGWQAEQQKRTDQAERLNHELEGKVADRTRELQTTLGQLEETNSQLVETNDALTQAGKAKSQFLATVSHELRTPLNAVIGFSELLANQHVEGLSDRQQEFLGAIHDGGEHLLALINDILDLSKIESGRMPLNLEVVNVAAVMAEVTSLMGAQASESRITLHLDCDSEIGRVSVDPKRFREVLLNLVSNAVKFTPEEGQVGLIAEIEESDLVIQVTDTGIGISVQDQTKIFEEFYQVDGSYTRKFQGTGLGLGLVRRMMEIHGGTVAVTSKAGQGSTFTCRFPDCQVTVPVLDEEHEIATENAVEQASHLLRPDQQTILVAVGNPMTMRLATNALKSRGYRVLEAVSAESLLQVARTQEIDLVLVAPDLRGLDSFTEAAGLRNEPAAARLKVVALAGSDAFTQETLVAAGFDGLIPTPVKINRLPFQVRTCLERKENVA
jgi:signal transduction histidine kinase/CheY-like chemotaxis protein